VPLVHLGKVLDLEEQTADGTAAINVVLLSGGAFRYGLVVEHLHGTVEIVVKPLGRHLKHLREYAGATILGDGCVALILDVSGMATAAGLTPHEKLARLAPEADIPEEVHQLLLFRNSAVEACAVPLHDVARVLKVQPEEVELVGGRRTMQHRGRNLPLVTLADLATVEAVPLDQKTIVVVMEAAGREFGLVAARPVDVVEAVLEIDPYTHRQPGVAGSAIVHGSTTLVLDASELAAAVWPEPDVQPGRTAPSRGATVLVAEDSAFFREQILKILQSEGCHTLAAADGQAAWEILQSREHEIALLVTDVEMPILDGLQLTRRIRADAATAALPIILLTALAGEGDMERGRAAGATAYCVKLDREQLVGIARELLGSSPAADAAAACPGLSELARHVNEQTQLVGTGLTANGEMK
jgi:two-component system, chemotaxis family, sensor kinase CheA